MIGVVVELLIEVFMEVKKMVADEGKGKGMVADEGRGAC